MQEASADLAIWAIFSIPFSVDLGGGFGGGRSANPNAPRRGEDIRANVVLDFMEACKGKTVKIRINRAEKCPDCHGTGAAAALRLRPVLTATALVQ